MTAGGKAGPNRMSPLMHATQELFPESLFHVASLPTSNDGVKALPTERPRKQGNKNWANG